MFAIAIVQDWTCLAENITESFLIGGAAKNRLHRVAEKVKKDRGRLLVSQPS